MLIEKPIISIIDGIKKVSGQSPCKKTVQKVVYLIEESGNSMGFDYTIHFYGPYSADLDYEIQNLSAKGSLEIEYTRYGHLISVPNENADISELDAKTKVIIQYFGSKSASELELLATTLFVQRHLDETNAKKILPAVKKIKGTKYSDAQINHAVQELHVQQYF